MSYVCATCIRTPGVNLLSWAIGWDPRYHASCMTGMSFSLVHASTEKGYGLCDQGFTVHEHH